MALPSSGAISLSDVNVELGNSATATISMNDSAVRNLFGQASGAVDMNTGYGKANQFAFSITSNQTNADLRTLAINAGWDQSSKVVATLNSGVYCSSNATGTAGLTISGSFPGGVDFINNGTVVGRGGNGGSGGYIYGGDPYSGGSGSAGGIAMSVSTAVSITNNGTIAAGGGGGGGGGAATASQGYYFAGGYGGAGGGGRSSLTNSSGGNAGTISAAGAGANGGYGSSYNYWARGGNGGSGGNWGASGSTGGGGSASYANTVKTRGGGSGGGGGTAISGNGNITWVATGTRLGTIS